MEVSIFQSYQQEASHVLVFCQAFPSFPASSLKKYPTVNQGLLSQKMTKKTEIYTFKIIQMLN